MRHSCNTALDFLGRLFSLVHDVYGFGSEDYNVSILTAICGLDEVYKSSINHFEK